MTLEVWERDVLEDIITFVIFRHVGWWVFVSTVLVQVVPKPMLSQHLGSTFRRGQIYICCLCFQRTDSEMLSLMACAGCLTRHVRKMLKIENKWDNL